MSHCIKVLELFSGIGGMHFALKEAENILGGPAILNFDIVRAIDISDIANQVYKHNFPKVDVKGSNICGLTAEMLDKMAIEAIFMSPPCQPFTRQGHQKDLKDSRSQPLVHIVEELIPKAKKLNYILLENVKGFENSEAHQMLITSLCNHGFKYQEFLICPKQLGIPNSRLRYYIIAKKSGEFLHQKQDNHLITDLSTLDSTIIDKFKKRPIKLKQYLNDAQDPFQDHLERLDLDAKVLDIVNSESEGSCCFTKSYGRYAEGTGKTQLGHHIVRN
jgi:tRNA (cytosine38-C5)-methyltransferase